jgi:hypothetical protein
LVNDHVHVLLRAKLFVRSFFPLLSGLVLELDLIVGLSGGVIAGHLGTHFSDDTVEARHHLPARRTLVWIAWKQASARLSVS